MLLRFQKFRDILKIFSCWFIAGIESSMLIKMATLKMYVQCFEGGDLERFEQHLQTKTKLSKMKQQKWATRKVSNNENDNIFNDPICGHGGHCVRYRLHVWNYFFISMFEVFISMFGIVRKVISRFSRILTHDFFPFIQKRIKKFWFLKRKNFTFQENFQNTQNFAIIIFSVHDVNEFFENLKIFQLCWKTFWKK